MITNCFYVISGTKDECERLKQQFDDLCAVEKSVKDYHSELRRRRMRWLYPKEYYYALFIDIEFNNNATPFLRCDYKATYEALDWLINTSGNNVCSRCSHSLECEVNAAYRKEKHCVDGVITFFEERARKC